MSVVTNARKGVAGPIWSKTLEDPDAVMSMISTDQWPALKKRLDDLQGRTNADRAKLFQYPKINVAPSNDQELADRLKKDYEHLEPGVNTSDDKYSYDPIASRDVALKRFDPDNRLHRDWFRKLIEAKYLALALNGGGDFMTWYKDIQQFFINHVRLTQISSSLAVLRLLKHDERRLADVVSHQEWALGMHKVWDSYLDSHIREQYALLEKMDAVLSTQKRHSIFAQNDISTMNVWERWVTRIFFLLCLVVVVILIIQNAGAIGGTLRATQAKLATAKS